MTPVIGAALAAVGAAALIGFALLAQVTAPDLSTAPHETAVGSSGTSPNAIVLPTPSPNRASGEATAAGTPSGTATAAPGVTVAFVPDSGIVATPPDDPVLAADPRDAGDGLEGPGFAGRDGRFATDGDDDRRLTSASDRRGKEALAGGRSTGRFKHKDARDDRTTRSADGGETLAKASSAGVGSKGHGNAQGNGVHASKGNGAKDGGDGGHKDKAHRGRSKGGRKH